jgi:hypothetical protein
VKNSLCRFLISCLRKKFKKAKEVIEKQRLVMGLPALNEREDEIVYRHQRGVECICMLIERTDFVEKRCLELENELKLLDEKLYHSKHELSPTSLEKINEQRKELVLELQQTEEELMTPRAPREWRETRYIYEKLASLFGFNEEWVDKIANISQIVDNFHARLIK